MSISRRNFIEIATAGAVALVRNLSPMPSELFADTEYSGNRGLEYISVGRSNLPFSRQKELAGFDEFPMITESNIQELVHRGRLVVVPDDTNRYYNNGFPKELSVLRPEAKFVLELLARDYHEEFGKRFPLNSLSRTERYQLRLKRRNSYAVDPDESGHVRGASGDISYRKMPWIERRWLDHKFAGLKSEHILTAVKEPPKGVYAEDASQKNRF